MRRIIEELVEKRKKQQWKVRETLNQLGQLIRETGFFFNRNKKSKISDKLVEFYEELHTLITLQDREWDAYSNNHSTGVFKSIIWKIEKLEAEYSNVKGLLINFLTLEKSLENLIQSMDEKTDPDKVKQLQEIKEQLSTYQYSDFEHRFRGNEDQVKEKLKIYLPIFSSSDSVLDIGCGRGEFIELAREEGKQVLGIDTSKSMLQITQGKGLPCQLVDALQYLQKQEDNSVGGIFSSQVIEHLEPDYLREMVLESRRVLTKGSPMVLETINPLSLFALSNIYFLDVTHQKPLHPEYMRYLLESSGFSAVEIIYPEELRDELLEEIGAENQIAKEFNSNVDKLNKLLFSSPVYAVRGNKK